VAATGVTQTLVLPAGLTSNGGTVTTTNSGVYNNQTGVVTFTVGSLAAGASVPNSATISLPPSPTGSPNTYALTALGSSFTANPETNLTDNTATTTVNVTPKYDLTAALSGPTAAPAGSTVTYAVALTNAGPSSASGVTGTFTLPAGVTSYTATSQVVTGGNATSTTYTGVSGTVTFRTSNNLLAGQTELWQISFAAPSSTYVATAGIATSSSVTESNVLPNSASMTTVVNQAPVAYDVVNKLQAPQGPLGNTAAPMPLTPLSAGDTDNGAVASYTLLTLPSTSQGTLYYNGAQATANQVITDPSKLSFAPASGFVGNAFFTFSAIDNGNSNIGGSTTYALSSAPARYTIPVGADNSSVATAATQVKGGSNPYVNGDILAYVVDTNGAQYTANSGNLGATPGLVYNAATGVLLSGAANGLASAVLAASGPSQNPTNTLPAGVSLDPVTGQLKVDNTKGSLPNIIANTTYYVNVVTTDVYGGTNTVTESFTLGAYPLPVELVKFDAQAVQNRDAQLSWTTASELHNDHFEVERSLDGVSFAKVGQVAGQGSKATATTYAFTDAGIGPKAAGQPVYYRLKQVDSDGTASYSPVRSVRFTSQAALALTLYPNPASAATSLDLSTLPTTGTYQVVLLDATGRQVRQLSLGGGLVQNLALSDLATGTYQVVVSGQRADGSVLRQVLRLNKE
jgi:uncharacterized repeat protein (TIGR01451 family)